MPSDCCHVPFALSILWYDVTGHNMHCTIHVCHSAYKLYSATLLSDLGSQAYPITFTQSQLMDAESRKLERRWREVLLCHTLVNMAGLPVIVSNGWYTMDIRSVCSIAGNVKYGQSWVSCIWSIGVHDSAINVCKCFGPHWDVAQVSLIILLFSWEGLTLHLVC